MVRAVWPAFAGKPTLDIGSKARVVTGLVRVKAAQKSGHHSQSKPQRTNFRPCVLANPYSLSARNKVDEGNHGGGIKDNEGARWIGNPGERTGLEVRERSQAERVKR